MDTIWLLLSELQIFKWIIFWFNINQYVRKSKFDSLTGFEPISHSRTLLKKFENIEIPFWANNWLPIPHPIIMKILKTWHVSSHFGILMFFLIWNWKTQVWSNFFYFWIFSKNSKILEKIWKFLKKFENSWKNSKILKTRFEPFWNRKYSFKNLKPKKTSFAQFFVFLNFWKNSKILKNKFNVLWGLLGGKGRLR